MDGRRGGGVSRVKGNCKIECDFFFPFGTSEGLENISGEENAVSGNFILTFDGLLFGLNVLVGLFSGKRVRLWKSRMNDDEQIVGLYFVLL